MTASYIVSSSGVRFNRVDVTPPDPDPQNVYRVRDAVDPVVIERQGIADGSNFAPIKLAGFDASNDIDWNAIKKYQAIDYNYLKSLQFDEGGKYGTIEKKMNWLVNHSGEGKRPYFIVNGQCRFGTILFGGQDVMVEMDGNQPKKYVKFGQYPNRSYKEDITFYRVIGLPKSAMNGATFAKYPYWVVRASSFNANHEQTYTPRGVTHYHPVWNTDDYPSNYADGRLYVAIDFLKI